MLAISFLIFSVDCNVAYDEKTKTLTIANIVFINKGMVAPYPDAVNIKIIGNQAHIEDDIFKGNKNIRTLSITGNQCTVGSSAFQNTSLITFSLSGSQSRVSSSSFKNCDLLRQVTIVGIQARIESNAFKNCHGLSSLTITSNQLRIESYAFCNCENLTGNVKIAGLQQEISSHAYDCSFFDIIFDNKLIVYGAAAVVVIVIIIVVVVCVVKKKKREVVFSSSTIQMNILNSNDKSNPIYQY